MPLAAFWRSVCVQGYYEETVADITISYVIVAANCKVCHEHLFQQTKDAFLFSLLSVLHSIPTDLTLLP